MKNLFGFGLGLAVLAAACGAAPQGADVSVAAPSLALGAPETFAIDPAMPSAQAEVVRDVVAAWCASARTYCPTEVDWTWARARLYWATEYAQYNRQEGSCAFTVQGDSTIRLNADSAECFEDLHVFWLVAAHEVGHLSGLVGHGHGLALMADEPDWTMPLAIQ